VFSGGAVRVSSTISPARPQLTIGRKATKQLSSRAAEMLESQRDADPSEVSVDDDGLLKPSVWSTLS
jgi:hypothetical protein